MWAGLQVLVWGSLALNWDGIFYLGKERLGIKMETGGPFLNPSLKYDHGIVLSLGIWMGYFTWRQTKKKKNKED